MKIELYINENTIKAIATINLTDNGDSDFSFYLNRTLTVEQIICNNNITNNFNTTETTLNFRPCSNLIEIHNNGKINSLIIQYAGKIDTYYNVVTKDIKSLNWYSVWFPQDTSIPIPYEELIIYGCSDYIILKSIYDPLQQSWKYDNNNFDSFNIIAYRKETLCMISNPLINVYSTSEQLKNIALIATQHYRDILDYFNGKLFCKTTIPVLDLAFLYPTQKDYGSFKRKDLIVTTGADCNTWEDWLNETTAEWAALLYALKSGNHMLFDSIIQPHLDCVANYPSIKTADGARPLGVHTKGTILFYDLYKYFGVQVMEELIRLYSIIETKTTASYLEKIKLILGNRVSTYISEKIYV